MAYRKSTDSGSLQDVLDRVAGRTVIHKPVVYCAADISRAKTVLDRLNKLAARCEPSYTSHKHKQIEES